MDKTEYYKQIYDWRLAPKAEEPEQPDVSGWSMSEYESRRAELNVRDTGDVGGISGEIERPSLRRYSVDYLRAAGYGNQYHHPQAASEAPVSKTHDFSGDVSGPEVRSIPSESRWGGRAKKQESN